MAKNNPHGIEVGIKVYVRTYRRGKGQDTIEERTVTKVGSRYFEVSGIYRARFHLDSLKHDGGEYSSKYGVYMSMEAFNDEMLKYKLVGKVYSFFKAFPNNELSLDQLKRISAILDE